MEDYARQLLAAKCKGVLKAPHGIDDLVPARKGYLANGLVGGRRAAAALPIVIQAPHVQRPGARNGQQVAFACG